MRIRAQKLATLSILTHPVALVALVTLVTLVTLVALVTLVTLVTPASLKRSKQDFNRRHSGTVRHYQVPSGTLRHSLKCSTSTATQPSSSATRVSTATTVS